MIGIDDVSLKNKTVLVRVDYNISLDERHHIINDERIKQSLPTLELLLKNNNTLILLSHLGKPHGPEEKFSLKPVSLRLQQLLPSVKIVFIEDFKDLVREKTRMDNPNVIFMLENIRFHKGEDANDLSFAKDLASLADVYVNDAFSVSHREAASIVLLPTLLPSFAGILMKKEVEEISRIISSSKRPFVSLLGGAKISTKIKLLKKIITLSDEILLGGGLANTFLLAKGIEIGHSLAEISEIKTAQHLLTFASENTCSILLPVDAIVGDKQGHNTREVSIRNITKNDSIFDIGPQTQALYGAAILQAQTILWNGPFGVIENPVYKRGTDFLYYTITQNPQAHSLVGGGETLAALSKKEDLDHITHISTGGGAMLSYIENGSLVGIDALNKQQK